LDPNTKGGALVLMVVLFVVPYLVYQVMVSSGTDEIDAGIAVGMGFTIFSMLAWVSTYIFRVATKDMTYVRVCVWNDFYGSCVCAPFR
jgi:cytochrome c oxidase assembly factor CtaG